MPDPCHLTSEGRRMPAAMTGVLPEELEMVWPLVAGLLAAVCTRSRGKESLVELRAALGAGSRQLWVWCSADAGVQALAVTDIAVYPAARICRISICTGDRGVGARAGLRCGRAVLPAGLETRAAGAGLSRASRADAEGPSRRALRAL